MSSCDRSHSLAFTLHAGYEFFRWLATTFDARGKRLLVGVRTYLNHSFSNDKF